jgi:predicted O-methyltransferase YrrM
VGRDDGALAADERVEQRRLACSGAAGQHNPRPLSDQLPPVGMLEESQADTFDFAFIDADKANYCDYYMKVVQLVRPGGLIVLDNVLRSGEVLDPLIEEAGTVAVRKLNKRIMKDERVQTCMLPIADGVTLAIKRSPAPG